MCLVGENPTNSVRVLHDEHPFPPLTCVWLQFESESSFEDIDHNGFDQLCRNYAVEKFHKRFLQDQVCAGGAEGSYGGIKQARNMREVAAQVERSRLLLVMFEGEERGNVLRYHGVRGDVCEPADRCM